MKKIETLEELIAERKRLNAVAKQMEDGLQEDFQYFSNHIQPFLSIFDSSKSSSKMSSILLKGAAAIVPLLLSGRKARVAASTVSPWMALGTTAIGLLAGGQASGLVEKISGFLHAFSKKKKAPKHRKHKLCRCK